MGRLDFEPTGVLLADTLPTLSVLGLVPAAVAMHRRGRTLDASLFAGGVALATLYHVCILHGEEGSELLGVPGHVWRTMDVAFVQFLLARTAAFALGCTHPLLAKFVPNVVLPAMLAALVATRGAVMELIVALMLSTAMMALGKPVLESGRLPRYDGELRTKLAWTGLLGMACFAAPLALSVPRLYWLFHSAWHVLGGAMLHTLYSELPLEPSSAKIAASLAPDSRR